MSPIESIRLCLYNRQERTTTRRTKQDIQNLAASRMFRFFQRRSRSRPKADYAESGLSSFFKSQSFETELNGYATASSYNLS